MEASPSHHQQQRTIKKKPHKRRGKRDFSKTVQNEPRRNPSSTVCGVCTLADGRYKCPKCRLPYCTVPCWKNHQLSCPFLLNKSIPKAEEGDEGDIHHPTTTLSKNDDHSKYIISKSPFVDPLDQPNARRMNRNSEQEDDDEEEEEEWKITPEMIQRLNHSEWLRKELCDGGLRRIICNMDTVQDIIPDSNPHRRKPSFRKRIQQQPVLSAREQALVDAKASNVHFSNFMDRLLFTAGVLVPHESLKKTRQHEEGGVGDEEDETEAWEMYRQQLVLLPIAKKPTINLNRLDEESYSTTQDDDESDDDDEDDDGSSNQSEVNTDGIKGIEV